MMNISNNFHSPTEFPLASYRQTEKEWRCSPFAVVDDPCLKSSKVGKRSRSSRASSDFGNRAIDLAMADGGWRVLMQELEATRDTDDQEEWDVMATSEFLRIVTGMPT